MGFLIKEEGKIICVCIPHPPPKRQNDNAVVAFTRTTQPKRQQRHFLIYYLTSPLYTY